jgi:hypothetical protein
VCAGGNVAEKNNSGCGRYNTVAMNSSSCWQIRKNYEMIETREFFNGRLPVRARLLLAWLQYMRKISCRAEKDHAFAYNCRLAFAPARRCFPQS